jgi:hypothetical protein
MKSLALIPVALIAASLTGCATSAEYCDVARQIRPSVADQLTDETKRQILTENEKLAAICGVDPRAMPRAPA